MSHHSYKRRVLHIDGQWKTHDLVKEMVEKVCPDCELVTAESGAEALKLIQSDPFDLVIVDPWASEVNGLKICRYVSTHQA